MGGSINPLAFPVILRLPDWLPPHTPADGCLPLARLVVAMLEPAQVVALGVGRGETYAALCQSAQALRRFTRCVGVELGSAAADEAQLEFRALHTARYGAFSRLITAQAQSLAANFADASVDLLHLSADLEPGQAAEAWRGWQPKLSPRAAVLVSHIQPANSGPGLTHFWAEARQTYPHFELLQGQGLGLLLVGAEPPECLAQLPRRSAADGVALTELLYRLGQAGADPRLAPVAPPWPAKDTEIAALNQALREQTEHLDQVQGRLDLVTAREREIRALYLDLHQQLLDRDQNAGQLAERDRIIAARDETIARQQQDHAQALAQAAAERDQLSASRDQALAERDLLSAARDQALAERDRLSAARDEVLTGLRADLALAQAEIRTIHAGRIWRLAVIYWRISGPFLAQVRRPFARAK
jgi:hypothetical protein